MAAVAVVGLLAGLAPFNDNSFFTHLTTGRGIVDSLSVPHTDPYTFTSAGEPWVVQSWLASALYGGLDAVGGVLAIRIFTGVVTAALAALVWRLSRPAGALLPRLALSGGTVLMGIVVWSERPLLLGLLFFALTLALVHEDRIDVRWAVPLFWVWANVHGSFPLGLVLLGTLWVGGLLDRTRPQRTTRLLLWSTVGAVLGGVLNPYGVRLLVFPLDLLSKREQLQHVVEWQRPDLGDRYAQIFVVVAVVAVVAAIRSRRWAVLLPVAVFLIAALLGARNVAVASIAFAGIAAPALHGIGSITTSGRGPRARLTVMVAAALALVGSVVLLGRDNFELRAYPVEAVEWIDANGGFDGARAMGPHRHHRQLPHAALRRCRADLHGRPDGAPSARADRRLPRAQRRGAGVGRRARPLGHRRRPLAHRPRPGRPTGGEHRVGSGRMAMAPRRGRVLGFGGPPRTPVPHRLSDGHAPVRHPPPHLTTPD